MGIKNFGYLGEQFQLQLINQIVIDKEFGRSIMDVMSPSYFENKYYKIIIQMIKEYNKKYSQIPSFDTLCQMAKSDITVEIMLKIALDTITSIKEIKTEGEEFVKEKALKFCKQQELKKAMKLADKIISDGEFENYDQVEPIFRNALQVGEMDRGRMDVFDNIENVLEDDFRHPIPTGMRGIDRLLKGGLAKGEIGLILAPTGVGKSTVLSKLANNAFNMGYNVVQIIFEDNPKIIQRKHLTMWTKIAPDDLNRNKEAVLSKINELKSFNNKLIIKKLPSDSLTMQNIKNQIRKMISEGIRIDLLCLDYIDCVLTEKNGGDEWKGEGSVIRGFEAMCHEFNIVGWTATQGNRSSISSDVVTTDQMGGSIKKAQVGHVIISIAKSLLQKENKLATIAITKSRIGKDGVIFENCKFDNEMLEIDTDSSITFLGHQEEVEDERRRRQKEIFERREARMQTVQKEV